MNSASFPSPSGLQKRDGRGSVPYAPRFQGERGVDTKYHEPSEGNSRWQEEERDEKNELESLGCRSPYWLSPCWPD